MNINIIIEDNIDTTKVSELIEQYTSKDDVLSYDNRSNIDQYLVITEVKQDGIYPTIQKLRSEFKPFLHLSVSENSVFEDPFSKEYVEQLKIFMSKTNY